MLYLISFFPKNGKSIKILVKACVFFNYKPGGSGTVKKSAIEFKINILALQAASPGPLLQSRRSYIMKL